MTDMQWAQTPFAEYSVSSKGDVRNNRSGRILRPDMVKGGYLRVTFSIGGKTSKHFVNRLVCEAFHGPAPSSVHQARHMDGKSANNTAENVKWGTRSENEQDKKNHGTYQSREGNPFAKLTEVAVTRIRSDYASNLDSRRAQGFMQVEHGFVRDLAAAHEVSVSCIKLIVQNINWKMEA